MIRFLAFLYGITAYLLAGAVVLYFVAFLGDRRWLVPKTIDSGAPWSFLLTLLIDGSLIGVFALQHSGMARREFKRVWTRFVPPPIERSTYVLASSAALALVMALWQPLPTVLWRVENDLLVWLLQGLAALGAILVLASSFAINHFDLLGLRQTWCYATGRRCPDLLFQTPPPYCWVRHPIMVGTLIALWATPVMSAGRLLLTVGMTLYILAALPLEERDLLAEYGSTYADYQRRVGLLWPRLRIRRSS